MNSELHRTDAQKVSVILIDDINGGEADETVGFGLDGTSYEIDLNHGNSRELRDLLKPYIDKERKVTGPARRPSRPRATASGEARNKDMRAWAKAQGLKVSERGRVPADIVAQVRISERTVMRNTLPENPGSSQGTAALGGRLRPDGEPGRAAAGSRAIEG